MSAHELLKEEVTAFVADLLKEDDLGVVIRAHIRIENSLCEIVDALLKEPEYRKKLKLDYFNTVILSIALGVNKAFGPSLKAIGTLRNRFAHDLNTKLDSDMVSSIYNVLTPLQKDQVQQISQNLWEAHKPTVLYPKYKELSPRDQFISITIVLWGAVKGTVLYLRDKSREA